MLQAGRSSSCFGRHFQGAYIVVRGSALQSKHNILRKDANRTLRPGYQYAFLSCVSTFRRDVEIRWRGSIEKKGYRRPARLESGIRI